MTVYLDHAATTPMLPDVLVAYTSALTLVGNPSSIHSAGQNAKRMLEEARERVAASLGCEPIEVVFTGGGTEAVNLAVKGLYWARNRVDVGDVVGRAADGGDRGRGGRRGDGRAGGGGARARGDEGVQPLRALRRPRILAPLGEHHATIDTVEWLARHEGAVVEWIDVDEFGRIRLDALEAALDDDVALVTLLWANNEIGTIQPVHEVVELARRVGAPVHADAVAAYGQLPIDFAESGLAALSVSAHKIGGPLGIGALVLGRGADVEPLVHGGGQQRSVRSGTLDAPAAVGFGVAAGHRHDRSGLRDRLVDGVRRAVPDAMLRGHPVDRLPNNAHFTFPGCEGDSLLFLLDAAGIAVSTGSACQAGIPEPSHVLLGLGLGPAEARGALRFTVGHDSTDEHVDALLAVLPSAVEQARKAGFSDRASSFAH